MLLVIMLCWVRSSTIKSFCFPNYHKRLLSFRKGFQTFFHNWLSSLLLSSILKNKSKREKQNIARFSYNKRHQSLIKKRRRGGREKKPFFSRIGLGISLLENKKYSIRLLKASESSLKKKLKAHRFLSLMRISIVPGNQTLAPPF